VGQATCCQLRGRSNCGFETRRLCCHSGVERRAVPAGFSAAGPGAERHRVDGLADAPQCVRDELARGAAVAGGLTRRQGDVFGLVEPQADADRDRSRRGMTSLHRSCSAPTSTTPGRSTLAEKQGEGGVDTPFWSSGRSPKRSGAASSSTSSTINGSGCAAGSSIYRLRLRGNHFLIVGAAGAG
jgi:hypothetical protein